MKHRIRVAALITDEDRILLVQHAHPVNGRECWTPPGGGVESQDRSIFDCARREVFEETGLQVELADVVYLREFFDLEFQTRNLELYVTCTAFSGTPTIRYARGAGPDEDYIRGVRWIDREELAGLTVFPGVLKDGFWDDLAAGFPYTRYLGAQAG